MSKKIRSVDDGIALISLHDIAPQYEDEVVQSCDRLEELGILSYSLLVSPFYGMKRSNSFEKSVLFAQYLSALGLEISMHGYSHQTKSGTGAEFLRMTPEQIASRMKLGMSFLRKGIGVAPSGFIPPFWKAPQAITKVASDLGLKYCVIGDIIYDLKKNERYNTTWHIVSQGKGSLSHTDAFLELELGGPVQIGIHPLDVFEGSTFRLLEDMKDRLGYKFIGYYDYLTR
ncbi:MAG: DUF2334 domain-containing protein [Candidatus Thorarchaeota archaeon]|nr:DUF2334 domain-containing protein [Candidatus Thorarchaeota archaeon]